MFEVCFKDKQRPSMRFHQIVIFQGWWKSMNFVRRQMMVLEPLSTLGWIQKVVVTLAEMVHR